MTTEQMIELARANVDRHLGDVLTGDEDATETYDEVYTLAFDALHDAGVGDHEAGEVACAIANQVASNTYGE